jgi:hypothetical protein
VTSTGSVVSDCSLLRATAVMASSVVLALAAKITGGREPAEGQLPQ